ncbi:transcription elongation factor spt5, partial [Spiromyces aspiralis]
MAGVTGVVTGVEGDNIIKVTLELGGLMKEKQASFSFPAHHLRKRFREGDHVQVLNGRYKDETGMVISVEESIVTILSDLNLDEIRVFAKDLRESTDTTSASTQAAGNIELYDMVNLGGVEVGIVTKIENGSLRVLDQNGETRHMRPDQVTPIRKNTRNNVAIDGQGNTVGVGDKVREIGGAQREGSVLQLNRFVAFVQSREHADNGGVFAVRTRNIANTAAKPASMAPNPYGGGPRDRGGMPMRGRGRGRGGFGGRGRDRAIGKSVIIVRGPYKGYLGIVKESDGAMARVELHTDARVVTIEKDKLCLRGPNGERIPLSDMGPGPAPGGFSAPPSERQDSWGYGPPSGSRTPSRAGSVYGDGSQTSSWQGSTAWGDNGGSGWGSGAKTPAWGGGVPETPGVPTPSAGSIPPETP